MSVLVGLGTALPAELVERLQTVPHVRLLHHPHLLGRQRHLADHKGPRDPDRLADLVEQLRGCEVVLGVPGDSAAGLRALLAGGADQTSVRWVHGTPAGVGEQLRRSGLEAADLAAVTLTSSAGVHAEPLAEFALFGLLAFHKDLDQLLAAQAAGEWLPRWPMTQLRGRRLLVLGLGGVGTAVAAVADGLGMHVSAVRRNPSGDPPRGVAEVYGFDEVEQAVAAADDLVLALPGTSETEGLLGERLLGVLRPGGVVVNVGRGSCIDEDALAAALRSGHLRGAVLDVAAHEPRPREHPLWAMPNVLQSPHTAALSAQEDSRIVDLFLDNLARYQAGTSLRNVVRTDLFY